MGQVVLLADLVQVDLQEQADHQGPVVLQDLAGPIVQYQVQVALADHKELVIKDLVV